MKLAVVSTVLGAASADLALTWHDCGGAAKITGVVPKSVPLGTATTITGSGTSPVAVSGGNFAATVKAGWIPLASCAGPLGPAKVCTLPLGAGSLTLDAIKLPLPAGPASISLTVNLAASLPAQLASTTTHATATSTSGNNLVCLDVDLKDNSVTLPNPPGGIFDDILKVVCQLMENGSTEPEAEELICSKLHYNLEVEACDKVVDLLWKGFENKECPAGAKPIEKPETQFERFMQKFNKNYRDDNERRAKFEIFKQNLVHIIVKNARETGQATYGVNSLSDLSPEEFKRNYLGLKIPANMQNLSMFVPPTGAVALSSIDWVSRGAVTPVKDQGQCGSCWTFSTTGAIEGAWQIATGRLVSLSEQQIVDCASSAGQGCSGGWPNRAIQWEESQAICGENEYRYTARDGSCHACSSPVLARGSVTGVQYVSHSDSGLKAALAHSPVSVCVDAQQWSYYSGGIYSNCGTSLDHAVLAVGYDSSSWKVKNSWGTGWGERGYIRLAMGNTCGVLNNAVVALVRGSKEVVV